VSGRWGGRREGGLIGGNGGRGCYTVHRGS